MAFGPSINRMQKNIPVTKLQQRYMKYSSKWQKRNQIIVALHTYDALKIQQLSDTYCLLLLSAALRSTEYLHFCLLANLALVCLITSHVFGIFVILQRAAIQFNEYKKIVECFRHAFVLFIRMQFVFIFQTPVNRTNESIFTQLLHYTYPSACY